MRFDNLTTHTCLPCDSADMEITFTPEAGTKISAPSVVFIHCEDADADIFYTVDGSTPSAGSTPYMGKINLMEDDTLKAIAIRGDCSSEVTAAEYTYLSAADAGFLEFQFICDGANDKVGGRFEFAPNGTANDHHWRIKFTHPQAWFLHAVRILETDQIGVWNTGQGWSTKDELIDLSALYPIVLFNGGLQLNNAYADELALPFAPATEIQLEAYGQPSIPAFGYFELSFTFQIAGSEPVTIHRVVSHECAPGNEDTVNDDGGADGCGINAVTSVVSFGDNGDGVDILVGSFFAGMTVLIGDESIALTHLGRWIFEGNALTHVLRVYNADMEIVGTVTIDANGATSGMFLYGELATPIVLTAGETYHIVSEETVGGDEWSTFTGTVIAPHAGLTIPNAFYFDSEAHDEGAENNSYGPVGFKYCADSGAIVPDPFIHLNSEHVQEDIPAGTFTMEDQSGNGHHATESNLFAVPSIVAGQLNGFDAIRFPSVAAVSVNPFTSLPQFTAILVFRPGTLGGLRKFLSMGTSTFINTAGQMMELSQGTGAIVGEATLDSVPYVVSMVLSGDADSYLRVNGAAFGPANIGNTPTTDLFIGSNTDSGGDFDVFTLKVWDSVLTADQIEQAESDLRDKYGLL